MRVLVTGGSGFLGSFVVEELRVRGHEVVVVDTAKPAWTPDIDWFELDIRDGAAGHAALDAVRPEAVIHLAALVGTGSSLDHPQRTVEINVIGTINVMEAARANGVRRVVGTTTSSPWLGPYAISKRAATEFLVGLGSMHGVETSVLRLFNVYGPRQEAIGRPTKIIPRFIRSALTDGPLPLYGDGSQILDLVPVTTCAWGLVQALELAPGEGELIEIGSGHPITAMETAETVIGLVGGGSIELLPPRPGDGPQNPVADLTAARDLFGLEISDPLAYLADTVAWYRMHSEPFAALDEG